jgi:hypothetical protein
MRILQLIITLHISSVSFGQSYLNDTTLFNGTFCNYTAAYNLDSGTYVMGAIVTVEHPDRTQLMLGFYDNNGNRVLIMADYDTLNTQQGHGSIQTMFLNDRGNFVYYFRNCDSANCYPRIKEIDPNGVVVNDVKFNSLFDSMNIIMNPYNDIVQKKYDSTYVASAYGFMDGKEISLYLHLDIDFSILDTIVFMDGFSTWEYQYAEITELDYGEVLYAITNRQNLTTNQLEERINFNRISSTGTIESSIFYEDVEDEITVPRGYTRTSDGGFLFTYIGEHWISWATWENYHFLCKVDSNFNFEWKKKIRPETGTSYSSFTWNQEIKPTLDGNYIIGGAYPKPDSLTPTFISSSQLTKFKENGDFLWQRYIHLPLDIIDGNPVVEIKDVINTVDSGYVMVGQVIDYDLMNQ